MDLESRKRVEKNKTAMNLPSPATPICPTRKAAGFTLIELLVVIAILGVLLALLSGALIRAKWAAQRVACMNTLKQWGTGVHLYAAQSDDELPRESAVDGINSWELTAAPTNHDVWYNGVAETIGVPTMSQYAQTPSSQQSFYSQARIFHCPSARFSPISATYPNFSIAFNSKLMRDFEKTNPGPPTSLGGDQGLRLCEVKVPDRTALFLDNGVPGEARLCAFQALYNGQPKGDASVFPGRHSGGGNIVFVDGHVAWLTGKEVVEMDPTSVFRGRGIFPPKEVVWRHDPGLVP